jgi:Protein of unknown function (DUF2971)
MIFYKYFPPERASFFEDLLVRFTPANDLNDLLEGKPRYEWLMSPCQAAEQTEANFEAMLEAAIREAYEELPRAARRKMSRPAFDKFLQSTGKKDQLRLELLAYIDTTLRAITPHIKQEMYVKFCSEFGVFCLAEAGDIHELWAYYTNHKGFAVGFESSNAFFDRARDPDRILGRLHKVKYVDVLPNHETLATMTPQDWFLTKQKKWAQEREWRMIESLRYADRVREGIIPIHLFAVPHEAISEVLFGARIDSDVQASILSKLRSDSRLGHVKVFKVVADEVTESLLVVDL